MIYNVELIPEQVDVIVLKELQWAYEMVMKDWDEPLAIYGDKDENYELLASLKNVIKYFMESNAYDEYMAGVERKIELEKEFEDYELQIKSALKK